jgi:hypothetical protein
MSKFFLRCLQTDQSTKTFMQMSDTERFTMDASLPSNRPECPAAAFAKCLLERPLRFTEIAELSEKWDLQESEKAKATRRNQPLTFVVPAVQLVASISRFVE